jgi:hypothetical protein
MCKKTCEKQQFKDNNKSCTQTDTCVFAALIRQKKEQLANRKSETSHVQKSTAVLA